MNGKGGDGDGDRARERREVRTVMRAAFFLTPLVTVGFWVRFDTGILDAFFLSVLLVGLPLLALAQLLIAGNDFRIDRLSAYLSSASTILVLASVALVLGAFGPGLEAMSLGRPDPATAFAMFGLLATGAGLLTFFFHQLGRSFGWKETELLEQLLPRTRDEKKMFGVLSFVAGFGEEIVYRGYLMAMLVPMLASPWWAAVVSSLAFGLLHVYQGAAGIARTAILGLLFASSLVVGGTLWPAIACHTLIDLVGGFWLGPRLLRTDE